MDHNESTTSYPVEFTWHYPPTVKADRAPAIELGFMDMERLVSLNKKFMEKGWIKEIKYSYLSDKAVYTYEFSSMLVFVYWTLKKDLLKIFNKQALTNSYRIKTRVLR